MLDLFKRSKTPQYLKGFPDLVKLYADGMNEMGSSTIDLQGISLTTADKWYKIIDAPAEQVIVLVHGGECLHIDTRNEKYYVPRVYDIFFDKEKARFQEIPKKALFKKANLMYDFCMRKDYEDPFGISVVCATLHDLAYEGIPLTDAPTLEERGFKERMSVVADSYNGILRTFGIHPLEAVGYDLNQIKEALSGLESHLDKMSNDND